jgi:hypothetical protein
MQVHPVWWLPPMTSPLSPPHFRSLEVRTPFFPGNSRGDRFLQPPRFPSFLTD